MVLFYHLHSVMHINIIIYIYGFIIYMHSVYIMNISLMLMWHIGWNIQAGFPPVSSILPVASRRSISPIRYAIEAKWSVCPFAKQRKIPEQNGCYVWIFCIAILPSPSKWATQNTIPEKRQQTRSHLYIFKYICKILYNIVVKCLKPAACLEDKELLLYCFLENMSKHKHFHWNNTQALECCPNTLSIHRTCVELYPCTPRAPRNILWVRTASGLGVRPNLGGSSRPAVLSPQRLLEVGLAVVEIGLMAGIIQEQLPKMLNSKTDFCIFL